jgi:methionine synthase II (cobalamin-independent)
MTLATGIGSYPGEDAYAYNEVVGLVLGELPDLPHFPELPGRGAPASMTGRGLAIMAELGADLQPAGWRLTDSPGIDHRRARSLLAQDLDALEEQARDYEGLFKIQVAGPWTLAATVEKPKGDRLLSDHGARRELAQALAAGISDHVADVRRRLPGVELIVQVDEPALPAVLTGRIPTASGFHRHRSVDLQGAAPALEGVFAAITEAGAIPIVHCCAADPPFELLTRTGARGISVDLDLMRPRDLDSLAECLEAGLWVGLGVVPSLRPAVVPTEKQVTERVLRMLDMLGLDPGERLLLTPACGLAGADPTWKRAALTLCQKAARNLTA